MRMGLKSILPIIIASTAFGENRTTNKNALQSSGNSIELNLASSRFILNDKSRGYFNHTLNFVVDHSEFQPLVLSIGCFGCDSDVLDPITDYFKQRNLDHYRFNLERLARSAPNLRKGLTWIILVDDFHELETHLIGLTNLWNAASQFIILFIDDKVNEPVNDWIDIFRILWNRHRICKAMVASIHDDFRYLLSYSPFVKSTEEYGTVKRLDIQESFVSTAKKASEEANSADQQPKLFEDFENLNSYPIYITIFASQMMSIEVDRNNKTRYTMLDATVMKLIQERLRSKFRIKVLEVRNDGDPFEEALDDIEQGVSEIVFTGFFTKLYRRDFEFTASLYQDKLCLVAPSSKQLPKCFMPFFPFTKGLWLLLFVYNVGVALLWTLIQRLDSGLRSPIKIDIQVQKLAKFQAHPGFVKSRHLKPYNEPPEIHSCLISSFGLLSVTCYPLYGGKTPAERSFLLGSLFVSLVLIGLYQSCLVSSLSKPIYYPELDSLLDVAESNRTIITKYKNLQEDLFSEGSPVADRLRKKIEVSSSNESTFDMVAYRGFISLGRLSSFALENLTMYHDDSGKKLLLHMANECPATYALSYASRSSSPYLRRIDSLLLRIRQAGFIGKWYDEMLHLAKVRLSKSIRKRGDDEHVKLTLDHLSLTFLGLGIGLFCSTVVFLWELHFARKLRCPTLFNHPSSLS